MKRFFTAIAAAALIAFSAVPAFAYSSPEATVATDGGNPGGGNGGTKVTGGGGGVVGGGGTVVVDNGVSSPKTGSSESAAYLAIAVSLTVCGAAGTAIYKSKASK